MCEAENSIYCVCGYVVCVRWVSQSPIHPWIVCGGESNLYVCVCAFAWLWMSCVQGEEHSIVCMWLRVGGLC